MNLICKHKNGNYSLSSPTGAHICSLGNEITVFVRRIMCQTYTREINYIKYVVEIIESLIHTASDPFSKNNMAILCVPITGADCRIAMNVFKGDGLGTIHRMGLQEFRGEQSDYVMTIDGLLWDGKIIHVKDIVA